MRNDKIGKVIRSMWNGILINFLSAQKLWDDQIIHCIGPIRYTHQENKLYLAYGAYVILTKRLREEMKENGE